MAISENVHLLLRGSIRKNMGDGLRFYQARRKASINELKQALDKMKSHRYGEYMYTYFNV